MDQSFSFDLPYNNQDGCALFETLPGEVRDRIYTFSLSCDDDPTQLRIYREAWFRPWASLVQRFWLTVAARRPDNVDLLSAHSFQKTLQRVWDSHGRVELSKVQVFPQLWKLENGGALEEILSLDHLHPLSFTITIRHHDWWYWEDDTRLHIDSGWVNVCRFPDSLRRINVELESLQRKKDQIDWMAEMMRSTWHFQTRNLTIFSASKEDVTTSTWTGSSVWNGQRWVRDETRPEEVDYYIKTVTWRPDRSLTRITIPAPTLDAPESRFKVIEDSKPALPTFALEDAHVPPGTSANEAKRMVLEHEMRIDLLTSQLFDSDTNPDHYDDNGELLPEYLPNQVDTGLEPNSDGDTDDGLEDGNEAPENNGQNQGDDAFVLPQGTI